MEISFTEDDHFVLEVFEENDDGMDENDNYKPIEQTKIQQPVDFAASKLDIVDDPCTKISLESTQENVFFEEQNLIARKRQTTLTEYFFARPSTETSIVKPEQDDALDKMVNISLLINQLLNARVVLTRLPEKPVEHPEIQTSTLLVSKHLSVQRYCYKCKTLNIDHTDVRKAKNCSKCEADLLYVCDSCNENHYHGYDHLRRHRKRCNGEKTGKSLEDVTLIYCANCSYKTSHEMHIKGHLMKTGHQILEGKKTKVKKLVVGQKKEDHESESARKPIKNQALARKIGCQLENHIKITDHNAFDDEMTTVKSQLASQLTLNNPWKNQVDQLQFLVNQTNIDYSVARKRYCPSCAKIITSSSTNNYATCKFCTTTLLYQCGKCSQQYTGYTSIQYHIRCKCYPSLYRCRECKFTATIWDNMKKHLKKKHFPKLLRKVNRDVQTYEGKQFMCEHCLFGTDYKKNFERHLQSYHRQLFI